MKKATVFLLCIFLIASVQQFASAQSLEGTWLRAVTLTTECPGVPPISQDFTDTVTYTEFDRTIELPDQYQNCELESDGNEWNLDCTYDEEIELCTYHFHLTGSGGLGENEFDFQFTAEYTVSGGIGCELVPLCVITGDIHGTHLFATSSDEELSFGERGVPISHGLFQNYPNPFNPTTHIRYQIVDMGVPIHTTLKIYNILGQEVLTLVDEEKKPGHYIASWDGRDKKRKDVSSGFFFYRLEAGGFCATKCMLLLR